MIVLDASAVLEVLLRTPRAPAVEAHMFAADATLHAPHLIDVEVAQVLRRHAGSGQIAARRAGEALDDLRDLALERYPHHLFLPRIWELRANVSAYDAAYVALAEALEVPLLTCDRRLAATPGHGARILIA